jgi:PPOX class probable F420-dependent enzyme
MAITLTDDVKRLFDGPNFAHLATVMPDGSPQSAPVWVTREGDRILVGTGEGSLKAKNTRRDPRVALSIVDGTNPYVEAQIRGRVVERRPDPKFEVKDETAHKYTGKPFPWRNPDAVTLVIEVDRAKFARLPFVHALGGGAPAKRPRGHRRRQSDESSHRRLPLRSGAHHCRAPASASAAAFSTVVPRKKSGFTSPQKRTALPNTKSRKSSSVRSPCSTSS